METQKNKPKIQIVDAFKPFLTEKVRYKVAYGGRGGAKSENIARILLIKAMQKKLRIWCTRFYQSSIEHSVYKLLTDIIYDCPELFAKSYKVSATGIIALNTGSEFIFKGLQNIHEIKSMQAVDICWVEEAANITDECWNVLLPTIRADGSEIWISFNPVSVTDAVYRRFVENQNDNQITLNINFDQNPFFPEVLEQERLNCLKNNMQEYENIWLGVPYSKASNALFDENKLTNATISVLPADEGLEVWGIDVARHGNDKSVIAKRRNNIIYSVHAQSTPDHMLYADLIASEYACAIVKPQIIFVEINGMGGGLFDRLYQLGLPVAAADVGKRANNPKIFNKRSEMYKEFANAIHHKNLKLPEDHMLLTELATIEYRIDDKSLFRITDKESIKRKLGYSPDRADACALTFFAQVVPRYQTEYEYDDHVAW